MKFLNFIIVIEKEDKKKGYFAYSPTLPGCYSNGKTIEETRINMRKAIQLHLSSLLERSQPLPQAENLKHRSFLFDLKILFMTFFKVIRSEGVKH